MPSVRWTPQARRDLEAIEDYFHQIALRYASVVVGEILSATRRLETFPESGRKPVEAEGAKIREIVYKTYRIIYTYPNDLGNVDVLTVVHTSREPSAPGK
jgi:toxin ParE1/3/4